MSGMRLATGIHRKNVEEINKLTKVYEILDKL